MSRAITLVVTILRPLDLPCISPDDAAAAVGFVVESMDMGAENVAHLITYDDGTFECLSGRMAHRQKQPGPRNATDPKQET